jgi:hypothetical protein
MYFRKGVVLVLASFAIQVSGRKKYIQEWQYRLELMAVKFWMDAYEDGLVFGVSEDMAVDWFLGVSRSLRRVEPAYPEECIHRGASLLQLLSVSSAVLFLNPNRVSGALDKDMRA